MRFVNFSRNQMEFLRFLFSIFPFCTLPYYYKNDKFKMEIEKKNTDGFEVELKVLGTNIQESSF